MPNENTLKSKNLLESIYTQHSLYQGEVVKSDAWVVGTNYKCYVQNTRQFEKIDSKMNKTIYCVNGVSLSHE